MRFLTPLLLLTACSEANHIGNPLLLPIGALATAIDNVAYGQQRAKIKTYITQNASQMRIERFRGPVTKGLLQTIPASVRDRVRDEIAELPAGPEFAEQATIIVMVHRP